MRGEAGRGGGGREASFSTVMVWQPYVGNIVWPRMEGGKGVGAHPGFSKVL